MGTLIALPVIAVIVFVAALFLHMGASVAAIDGRGYGKALVSVVLCSLAGWILGGALNFLGMREGIVPLGVSVALNLFIIKSVFTTSWGKAFVAWLVQLVLTVVVVVIPLVLLVGAAAIFSS